MRKLPPCLAALALAALVASPAVAAPPPLESLPAVLRCGDADGFQALADALYTDDWPGELSPTETDGQPLGYTGFELARPVAFHGRQVGEIGFVQEWIVAPLPRDEARALAAELGMERAPIKSTEQHFKFLQGDPGPLFSVFSLSDAVALMFTGEPQESETLYAGCTYRETTREEFLAAAGQADEILASARQRILDVLNGRASPEDEAESPPDAP
jgi:hypothetical protein